MGCNQLLRVNECVDTDQAKSGKISTQPHSTSCIQFLDRENNDKNNTLPLGKQICFTIVWGCTEMLPKTFLLLINKLSWLRGDHCVGFPYPTPLVCQFHLLSPLVTGSHQLSSRILVNQLGHRVFFLIHEY